ncbi:MAG: hypothetical protein [Microviridae sp.]|nr:MAG: hypothetical protein [Microviridae sp.]
MKKETKLPRFKTNYNAHLYNNEMGEHNYLPSMTIHNDTYSLRDIMEKFSREYPKNLERNGYYDDVDENDFDDIDITRQPDFDLVDAHELRDNLKSKYKEKEQNLSSFDDNSKSQKNDDKKGINEPLSSSNPTDV